MSEEIQEAVQIVRVAYEGIEIALKVGGGTLEQMKQAVSFLIGLLDHEKAMGKTAMRKLLQKGGDLQVFQFDSSDMKKVEKMAKKYGVLYSVLPDINKSDGKSEIIFHSEAVPRVNMMIQKLKSGRIATFDDYLKNGDEKEMDKILSFLEGQKQNKKGKEGVHSEEAIRTNEVLDGLMEKVGMFAMEKKSISVDEVKEHFAVNGEQAETVLTKLEKIGVVSKEEHGSRKALMNQEAFQKRILGYQEIANRIRQVSASKQTDLVDITITKKLVVEESEHGIKTRIPGTWGENAAYLWTDKKDIMDIHKGRTILTFLEPDKEYLIYREDNSILKKITGKELYDNHYDSVGKEVRDRYQKEVKKAAAVVKTPTSIKGQRL